MGQMAVLALAITVGVAMTIMFAVFLIRRGETLESWSKRNRYEILARERRFVLFSPFWWRTVGTPDVFYVTVRTNDGEVRHGWVKCGGLHIAFLEDEARVIWDKTRF
jgi:hypothetical protein